MLKLSETQARWFRLRRSGLVTSFNTSEAAASALVGVQAQILPAAGLALWNRTPQLTQTQFDHLLYHQRSLVKLWGQRGTLHLYSSQEWPLLHGALAGQPTWWERQVMQNGGDVAAHHLTITRLAELLRQRGSLSRSDLRAAKLDLEEWHFSSWGGIFYDLVRHGYACHAEQVGNEGRFVHREVWLPQLRWNPPATDEANTLLTRRYLSAYGPATVQDLAYWRGVRIAEARRWLAILADEVVEIRVNGQPMLALRAHLEALNEIPPAREAWPVRLLYRFDPLLLGLKDKSWLVDAPYYPRVWRPAGHIEGTLLEHGRLVGTWRYDRQGRGLVVSIFPFAPLPEHVQAAVTAHATGIAEFFGVGLVDVVVKETI